MRPREIARKIGHFWLILGPIWPNFGQNSKYFLIKLPTSFLLYIALPDEFDWFYWSFNNNYDLQYFGKNCQKIFVSEVVVLQCKWFLAFLARNGLIFLASREKWKTGEMCISTYDFYNWILVSTSFCKLLEIWTSRTSFHISIALVDCQSPWDNSFFLFYLQIAHFLWHFCLLAVDGDSTKVLQDSTKTQTQNEMVFL